MNSGKSKNVGSLTCVWDNIDIYILIISKYPIKFSMISGGFEVYVKRSLSTLSHTAAAKSLQLCPTLCDPRDGSPPVPGILQARTLEWVAISFSNAWKWKVKVKLHSRVRLLATPWTAAYQAPPSMGFSRQEYWSRVPSPSPKKCLRRCWFPHLQPNAE